MTREPIPPTDGDDDVVDLTKRQDDQGTTLTAEDLETIAQMIEDAIAAAAAKEPSSAGLQVLADEAKAAELAAARTTDPVHEFASHDDAAAHQLLEHLRDSHRNGHPPLDLAAIAAAVEDAMRQADR